MNKKLMLLPLFAVLIVGTVFAIPMFYGMFSHTMNVQSSITFDCDDTLEDVWDGSVVSGDVCIVTNNAPTERSLNATNDAEEGIDVKYYKDNGYAYSADIAGVGVEVTDEEDSLKWTYTYSDTPTHTPKMTVAIDYPNGFAITTFDDGSHNGWYYAVDGETEVLLEGSEAEDWVVTTTDDNVLSVSIKKSALNNEFKWHGYANLDGSQVWINDQETGTGYEVNQFEVTLRELLDNPFVILAESSLAITPVYTISPGVSGEQVIETTIA